MYNSGMSSIDLGESIWRLIISIERLHPPLDPAHEFGKDLPLGAVKYLDPRGERKLFKINLQTQTYEIRESGRESQPEATQIELFIDGGLVVKGTLNLLLEDENEWIFQGSQFSDVKDGRWIQDIKSLQNRLNLALQDQSARHKANQDDKTQKRLAKNIQKHKKNT